MNNLNFLKQLSNEYDNIEVVCFEIPFEEVIKYVHSSRIKNHRNHYKGVYTLAELRITTSEIKSSLEITEVQIEAYLFDPNGNYVCRCEYY